MDASITKVLQAVQEEFPRARSGSGKPRRQSSNASSNSSRSIDIPMMDDNSLPTSSELYIYTGESPSTASALSTSPQEASNDTSTGSSGSASAFFNSHSDSHSHDGQITPRAERTAPLSREASQEDRQYISERQEVSTTSALPARIDTSVQKATGSSKSPTSSTSTSSRSPRLNSAPSFIQLPSLQSSNSSNAANAGFKPSFIQKSDHGLMLTPGGDDIPFQFKKRPNMQDRRPSHEIFA